MNYILFRSSNDIIQKRYSGRLLLWTNIIKTYFISTSNHTTYPIVNVYCMKCHTHLLRYHKKNGMKSSLIKCYIERIADDTAYILRDQHYISKNEITPAGSNTTLQHHQHYHCPNCQTTIARYAKINGLPSLKWVGGKIRMSKK